MYIGQPKLLTPNSTQSPENIWLMKTPPEIELENGHSREPLVLVTLNESFVVDGRARRRVDVRGGGFLKP